MLKILVSGACGKMGKAVCACALEKGYTVACGVDACGKENASFPVYPGFSDVKEKVDVIVDFSRPELLGDLMAFAEKTKTPCVIATTGLNEVQKARLQELSKTVSVFYSANFSLGVSVLCALCRRAAKALKDEFDIEILEKHHRQKVDAPSGTALMIADAISSVLDEKPEYVFDRSKKSSPRAKEEIGFSSVRGGSIVGEHDVIFAGDQEVLTVSHSAADRAIFASGALKAAQFLVSQKPGFYTMDSMLEALGL